MPRSQKDILTTGEVAKICKVAPRTVSKWFDSGKLRGYRIPGSRDRRIPRDQLIRFMRAHGMPLNGLVGGARRVVVADGDAQFAEALAAALSKDGRFEVHVARSAFEAGLVADAVKPDILVLEAGLAQGLTREIVRIIRAHPELGMTRLVAVCGPAREGDDQALLQQGFDAVLVKPFGVPEFCRAVEGAWTVAS